MVKSKGIRVGKREDGGDVVKSAKSELAKARANAQINFCFRMISLQICLILIYICASYMGAQVIDYYRDTSLHEKVRRGRAVRATLDLGADSSSTSWKRYLNWID